jgi:hypothetical protein
VPTALQRSSSNVPLENALIRLIHGGRGFLKILWSLQVPNAVKVFLWRAYHNLLPTKVNLFTRKVVDNNFCPVCHLAEEIVFHAIWGCPGAQDVWGHGPMCFQKCAMLGDNFTLLFVFFSDRLNI